MIVHDRYHNYDSAMLGTLVHQLRCQHLLRDLDGAAEVYPDAHWPTQIADALRGKAEHDLRPSKVQQNVSGRLTSENRTQDRYTIRGVVSTAAKHGLNMIIILGDALRGRPWMPDLPAPT